MTPLDTAVNRMAQLRAELAELETFVRVYYRLFPEEKLAAKLANGSLRLSSPYPVDNPVDKPVENVDSDKVRSVIPSGRKRRRKTTDPLVDFMELTIRSIQRPLPRSEIVAMIDLDGRFNLPEADKPRYVGTLLWRNNDRFRNLPGHGYWVRDTPYQPANYDPATDTEADSLLDEAPTLDERPQLDEDDSRVEDESNPDERRY